MRLSRRALLAVGSAIGLTGRVAADEEGDTDETDDAPGYGVAYGEAYGGRAGDEEDDDDVDECFIATAAEGTKDHPHVVDLRDFRDATLRSSWAGRLFIKTYYWTSPPIAEWIARSDRRRRWTRRLLVRPLSRAVTAAGLTNTDN